MPSYQVLVEAATVLKSNGAYTDADGKVVGYDHTSYTYPQGTIIPESDVSPVVIKLYDEGDAHTLSTLLRVDDVEPAKAPDAPAPEEVKEGAPKNEPVEEVEEPLKDYDSLTVAEIVALLDGASDEAIAAVKEYEANNKGRVTILNYEATSVEEPSDDEDGKE